MDFNGNGQEENRSLRNVDLETRMERISYMDKVTNEDVIKRVDEDRSILNGIWQRKHRWIGHVLRHRQFSARDF